MPREAVSKFLSLCTECKKQQVCDRNPHEFIPTLLYDNNQQNNPSTSIATTKQSHQERNKSKFRMASNYNNNNHINNMKNDGNVGTSLNTSSVDWEEKINLESTPKQLTFQAPPTFNQHHLYKPYESNNNNQYAGSQDQTIPGNINPNEIMTYYQLLKSFYENANVLRINPNLPDKEKTDCSKNFTISSLLTSDSISALDLTEKRPKTPENDVIKKNININIEDNYANPSLDVSINVTSTSCDELKISCKTTPPKKRYSGYSSSCFTKQQDERPLVTSTPEQQTNLMNNRKDDSVFGIKNLVDDTERTNSSQNDMVVIPITSTYLQMTRSMGLTDDDALNLVSFFKCLFSLIRNSFHFKIF